MRGLIECRLLSRCIAAFNATGCLASNGPAMRLCHHQSNIFSSLLTPHIRGGCPGHHFEARTVPLARRNYAQELAFRYRGRCDCQAVYFHLMFQDLPRRRQRRRRRRFTIYRPSPRHALRKCSPLFIDAHSLVLASSIPRLPIAIPAALLRLLFPARSVGSLECASRALSPRDGKMTLMSSPPPRLPLPNDARAAYYGGDMISAR